MSISVSAARLGCGSVGLGSVGLGSVGLGSGRCGRAAFRLGGSVPAARLGGLRLHVFGLGALGWLVRLLALSLAVARLTVTGLGVSSLGVSSLGVTGLRVSGLRVSGLRVSGLRVSGPSARTALALRRCSALSERLGESGGEDLLLVGAGRRHFERSLRSGQPLEALPVAGHLEQFADRVSRQRADGQPVLRPV